MLKSPLKQRFLAARVTAHVAATTVEFTASCQYFRVSVVCHYVPEDLPVSQHRERIMAVTEHQVVIVASETSFRKTTHYPKCVWHWD